MAKRTQSADNSKSGIPAEREVIALDKTSVRYIFRVLMLLALFTWALMNLDVVFGALRRVLALFSPFLVGGGIAFLINVVLQPLERCWRKLCRKAPAKLARPVCLTLSAILVLGFLFAVVFMMLPSLRESRRRVYPQSSGICR